MTAHRCKKCFHYDVEIIEDLNEIQWEYDARKQFFGYGDQKIKSKCLSCGHIQIENIKIKPYLGNEGIKTPNSNLPEKLKLKIEKYGLNIHLA
ncbi:MAG: hypothetical protein ACFFDN_00270 [Candidatus Hodarchaeota archaeon]